MAAGLREGWADVFLSDEKAYEKNTTQLKAMFQSLTGKGEAVAEKMASTFKALCTIADFSGSSRTTHTTTTSSTAGESDGSGGDAPTNDSRVTSGNGRMVSLHSDVHIRLPPTTDVAVYTAIFRGLREELLD